MHCINTISVTIGTFTVEMHGLEFRKGYWKVLRGFIGMSGQGSICGASTERVRLGECVCVRDCSKVGNELLLNRKLGGRVLGMNV